MEKVFTVRVRTQLLFPSTAVVRALWKYQYSRQLLDHHNATSVTLRRSRYHRVNAHEGLIDFEYELDTVETGRPLVTRFEDVRLQKVEWLEQHVAKRTSEERDRLVFVDQLLRDNDNHININKNAVVQTLVFWEEPEWWFERMRSSDQQWWTIRDGVPVSRQDFRRLCRLLNHLTRDLICTNLANNTEEAVSLLLRLPRQHCKLLNKLYVEPPMASLWAAYLSTTFMHHKQQHGLNTKHAAATAGQTVNTNNANSPINSLRSDHNFDAKICLDMCSSCDKKEIFEIMLGIDKVTHDPTPCDCKYCATLRNIANAWQYYDCGDKVWLRLEFNRRFYVKVSTLLAECLAQEEEGARTKIIYLSYKNEFTDRVKFMTNFVNYYAFYENSERPVSRDDCHGALREKISIIFVFALVNWELIERARKNNAAFNSISLNQQSIFKSLDNTLYAIFSENSINRMSKEKQQKLLNVNAPYVNRGFGTLPNCGINAFTTSVCDFVEL